MVESARRRAPGRARLRAQGRRRLAPARADRGARALPSSSSSPRSRQLRQTPGQGNYAAANAFLDALAQHRRAAGLPAPRSPGALWARRASMTAKLDEADRARISALRASSALRRRRAWSSSIAPAPPAAPARCRSRFDLRRLARAGPRPGPCRRSSPGSFARPAARRRRGSLAARFAAVPEARARGSGCRAGARRTSPPCSATMPRPAVDPEAAFKDLGFDSLAAVELRNRLGAGDRPAAAGDPRLRLPEHARRWPATSLAEAGRRLRHRRRCVAQGPRPRGADRDRRHGLPLPRRGRLPRGALAAARRRRRRDRPSFPDRPRLGPRAPL